MKIFKKGSPYIFILFLLIILFFKVFFLKEVYYTGDNFHLNIPEKYFLTYQIQQGIFPLWNPYLFIGIPYFADLNLGTLNPLNFIYFLLSVPQALTVLSIIDVFLIASFQYILLRYLKISKIGSTIGAVIFSFGGMPFIFITNVTILNVIVYIPLLFYLLSRFIQEKKLRFYILFILFQSIQIVSGHPQITYYTILFLSIYLLFWSDFTWKLKLFLLLSYYIFIVMLSFVQLFPFVEYVLNANRSISNITYASSGNLNALGLLTFLFPTFYGTYLDGTWWGPQLMLSGYIGIPSIIFLFLGIRNGLVRYKLYFVSSMFLSIILAIGKISPIYIIFYYFVPGWKLFRDPSDIITFYTFFASILGSVGFDFLRKNQQILKNRSLKILPVITVFFIFLSILFTYISLHNGFWKANISIVFNITHLAILNKLLMYNTNKLQIMFQGMMGNIIVALLLFIISLYLLIFFSKKAKLISVLFLLFISLNLVYFDSKIILTTSPAFYTNKDSIPSILNSTQKGIYRVLSLPVKLHQNKNALAPRDYFYKEGLANQDIFYSDNNLKSQIYQANGYTSLVPQSYAQFISGDSQVNNITSIDFSRVTKNELNEASIKYILTRYPIKMDGLRLINKNKGERFIYQNQSAHQRIYVLDESSKSVIKIKTITSTMIRFTIDARKAVKVIITNWYYPGWIAKVNNNGVNIVKYNGTFQSISVPAGYSSVVVEYRPVTFIVGMFISFISFFILSFVFFMTKNKTIT